MVGEAIAKTRDTQLFDKLQVFAPALVVTAFLQQVPADAASFPVDDGWVGTLDSGGEAKLPRSPFGLARRCGFTPRRAQPLRRRPATAAPGKGDARLC